MRTAACSSCGAAVIWTRTQSGKRMPVDAEPSPKGNILLGDGDPPAAIVITKEDGPCEVALYELHLSHFVTCPNAAQHRRKENP